MPDLKRTIEVTEEMLGRKMVYVNDARPGPNPLRMFPNRFRKRKVKVSVTTHDLRTGPEHILTMEAERNPFWVEQNRCWCISSRCDESGQGKPVWQLIEGRIDVEKLVNEVFGVSYPVDEYEMVRPIEHTVFEDLTEVRYDG